MAAFAVAATLVATAQTRATRLTIEPNVGLPAIVEGAIHDETHAPYTREALQRAAMQRALRVDGVGASGVPYARGRLIVKFKDGVSDAARTAVLAAASQTASDTGRPSYADFNIIRLDPAEDAEAVAAQLNTRPEIEYAQAAYRVHSFFVPNDEFYRPSARFTPGQWDLPLIGMESAWDIQPQAGAAITVAVVDSGMANMNATLTVTLHAFAGDDGTRYPALGNVTIPYSAASQLVAPGRIVAPKDFIWTDPALSLALDFSGHGTHVAGTIGQLTNDGVGTAGVAFNVKLMPVKVINEPWDDIFDSQNVATDEVVARGVRYAADNGANIINMSLGREGPPNTAQAIEDAIRYAVGKGAFVVISSGNAFEDGNPREVIAEIASRVQGAVSVAALDRNATVGDRRCRGSSASPSCHAYYSSSGPWVELSAPGGSERDYGRDGLIWQQTFDFNFVDTYLLPPSEYRAPRFDVLATVGYIGTSMAAPHVSGVAAMVMQQGIRDPAAIEAALEKFAIDLGAAGRDDLYGYGMIDARATLRGLGIAR